METIINVSVFTSESEDCILDGGGIEIRLLAEARYSLSTVSRQFLWPIQPPCPMDAGVGGT
jgi:hypothetical protein